MDNSESGKGKDSDNSSKRDINIQEVDPDLEDEIDTLGQVTPDNITSSNKYDSEEGVNVSGVYNNKVSDADTKTLQDNCNE